MPIMPTAIELPLIKCSSSKYSTCPYIPLLNIVRVKYGYLAFAEKTKFSLSNCGFDFTLKHLDIGMLLKQPPPSRNSCVICARRGLTENFRWLVRSRWYLLSN